MNLPSKEEIERVAGNHSPRQILKLNLSKEAILLNYADKRAMTKIVTLEERFAYFVERYNDKEDEEQKKVFNKYKEIETDIFNKLGFPAEKLAERIEENG